MGQWHRFDITGTRDAPLQRVLTDAGYTITFIVGSIFQTTMHSGARLSIVFLFVSRGKNVHARFFPAGTRSGRRRSSGVAL